jgi:glycosyltransferase involved in cell wall biosynthesis
LTQIELGAEPGRIQIVPNGIIPKHFDDMYQQVRERRLKFPEQMVVGFVGRVVPIKDVKTLIRSASVVCKQCPATKFLIAGPYAEDPAYFEECTKIVKMLKLEENVVFMGPQKLRDVLPKIDVLVLTSISEGLPLVMLEAMAAGIPMVATDVGACRELIFGRTPEDKALGSCGRITPMLSPSKTAQALLAILQDGILWNRMGEAGRKRVGLFYTMEQMLDHYKNLYLLGKVMPTGYFK